MAKTPESRSKAALGVYGLDEILSGGFARDRLYLLEGSPGTGKTTIALKFLLEGARLGEKGLYITLSETEEELRDGAASHGWTLDERIKVFELAPPESLLDVEHQQSLLYSSDLELGESTKAVFQAIETERPARVVLDSLSEIRLLAGSSLRYRRQILALKHYFARQGATVLMLDDLTADTLDKTVHSIAHGVIRLEEQAPEYGAERRRLRVVKYRGQTFRGGYHDLSIKPGGVTVYPRLVALEHKTHFARTAMTSGIPELDELVGGRDRAGLEHADPGPGRHGQVAPGDPVRPGGDCAGRAGRPVRVRRGDRPAVRRMRAMGIDLAAHQEAGSLFIEQVDAAELSPGEFSHRVRACIDQHAVRTVVIDSLNGYQAAMPEENALILHIHELLQYLNRQGASTFLTVAQHGLVGDMKSPVDITYLADTVVLLRYFEATGRVRRAISVIKKRTGYHEDTIRECRITERGLRIGPVLESFRGVLRGVPTLVGTEQDPSGIERG